LPSRSSSSRGGGRPRSIEWDRDSIVAAIRAWERTYGHPPTQREWQPAPDGCPNQYTVLREFGSWGDAIVAAGFERPRRGKTHYARKGAATAADPQPQVETPPEPIRSDPEPPEAPGHGPELMPLADALGEARGIEIEVDKPLGGAQQRLMDSLGVVVKVKGAGPKAPGGALDRAGLVRPAGELATLTVAADAVALAAREVDESTAAYRAAKAARRDSLATFVESLTDLRNIAIEAMKE
jgi:hypothetical protein